MEYYIRNKLNNTKTTSFKSVRLKSVDTVDHIWFSIVTGKPHSLYFNLNKQLGGWDLDRELTTNKVSELCIKQLWEF